MRASAIDNMPRIIIPSASDFESEGDVLAFDLELSATEPNVSVIGRGAGGIELTRIDYIKTGDHAGRFTLSDPSTRVEGTMRLASGPFIYLTLDGDEFVIDRDGHRGGDSDKPIDTARRDLLQRWQPAVSPMMNLGRVLHGPMARWGCGPCIVLDIGVAVGAGACVSGLFAACGGAIIGAAGFLENCEGACA